MEYHNNALRFDALTFENDNPSHAYMATIQYT